MEFDSLANEYMPSNNILGNYQLGVSLWSWHLFDDFDNYKVQANALLGSLGIL